MIKLGTIIQSKNPLLFILPESSSRKFSKTCSRATSIIIMEIIIGFQINIEQAQTIETQDTGQEFIVCNVLNLSRDDPTRLFKDLVGVPVRVDARQLIGDLVVLSCHDCVDTGETLILNLFIKL